MSAIKNRLSRLARSLLGVFVSLFFIMVIHEGMHVLFAKVYGEYAGIRIVWFGPVPFGIEVLTVTPLNDVSGLQWVLISGMSNFATLLIGYVLFSYRRVFASIENAILRSLLYQATFYFMMIDAFNLSLGPFIYGGDIQGIARGLNLNQYVLQIPFIALFLLNRELIAQILLPTYSVSSKHPFLVPWFRLPKRRAHNQINNTSDL